MAAHDSEFRFLVDCCRWPPNQAEQDRIREQSEGVDWSRFVRLAQRHRVEGLAARALVAAAVTVPAAAGGPLKERASHIARQNLLAVAECQRLRDAFARAGIQLLFVKGVTLGTLAYGSILPKSASDVDVLVDADELFEVCEELRHLGYRPVIPHSGDAGALERWHSISKESVWQGADRLMVELHTSLADHPELIPTVGICSPRQLVEVTRDVHLETLARDELFAYLCVHGASSAWFRLKWLADLAALLRGADEAETGRLYDRAVSLGAGAPAAAGLMLAHRLFGVAVPPERLRAWPRRPAVRWLVEASLKSMTGSRGETELAQVRLGSIWIHLAQLAMVPSLRGKVFEVRRQLLLSRRSREDRGAPEAAAKRGGQLASKKARRRSAAKWH